MVAGRGDRIRTCDLYVPNVALYQTELHPEASRQSYGDYKILTSISSHWERCLSIPEKHTSIVEWVYVIDRNIVVVDAIQSMRALKRLFEQGYVNARDSSLLG